MALVSISLVHQLIEQQFPHWAHLEIKPIEPGGIDNKTFRLGSDMLIRLPSEIQYAQQVEKEQYWLPQLASYLSLPIPEPKALGKPISKYPWHWSIYKWIEGESVNNIPLQNVSLTKIAHQLVHFLKELHSIKTTRGPGPGLHNFYRGGNLVHYDKQARIAIEKLKNIIDADAAIAVWEKALSSKWNKKPVWVHGDLSSGNMLAQKSKLVAIIDFGCMAIGDPACDLVIAWTLLKDKSRKIFISMLDIDDDTWTRARGWALWKALITLDALKDKKSVKALKQKKIIADVLKEY